MTKSFEDVLLALEKQPLFTSEIASVAKLTKRHVNCIANELAKRGLVTKTKMQDSIKGLGRYRKVVRCVWGLTEIGLETVSCLSDQA